MKRRRTTSTAQRQSSEAVAPASVEDNDVDRIVARPDGYHWVALDGRQEFGPFETPELAQFDMDAADEQAPSSTDTLQEMEQEIGIADWIDPDTGELAEGQSPPHLGDE